MVVFLLGLLNIRNGGLVLLGSGLCSGGLNFEVVSYPQKSLKKKTSVCVSSLTQDADAESYHVSPMFQCCFHVD